MQDILVSIIIPIYKVEPYIVRCIDSVLCQTYRHLEVILVDDCSPDRSMMLAQEHIEQSPLSKDLRFVYLKHDHNRGLSAARNTGIDAAKGEYIYFLDSDDEITPQCVETLTMPLRNKLYDVVLGDYETRASVVDFTHFCFEGEGEVLGSHDVAESYLRGDWYPMAWNKLCRAEYLQKNDMRFLEGLIHEDELWSFQMACSAKSFFFVNNQTYIYYIRDNSITTTTAVNQKERKIRHCLRALQGMYEYQEKHRLFTNEVEGLLSKFRKTVQRLMVSQNCGKWQIFRDIHSADTRSMRTKNIFYPLLKQKILNMHVFLPVCLAYPYRRLMMTYIWLRTHQSVSLF